MSGKAKPKERGRPATDRDSLASFPASPKMRAAIVKWAERQPDAPSLSVAARRLVELGLAVQGKPKRGTARHAERAKVLASKAIDQLTEKRPDNDEKASRKRRLIRGPEEFREVRVDRQKTKSK
jgi:hypothetical protein